MNDFTKALIPLLIRSFFPLNPFFVNYLADSKEFTNYEMSNLILPFYLYSSFFGI